MAIRNPVAGATATDARLAQEIREMARTIEKAKQDIASLRPREIGDKHVPTATVELDAIVSQTEEATNKIMDECDKINALAANAGDAGGKIAECITRIYEACNFQDLTGQRISKVVTALKNIEDKVTALVAVLGAHSASAAAVDTRTGDDRFLNGPALPGEGTGQDEIDRLLSGK